MLPVAVTLTYRPFLDPLDMHHYWMWLLPPLVLAISCVYKAIKLDDLAELPRQTLALTVQILAFMIMADIALWLVNELA